nr:IS66 family transposase [Paraglaciecola sp. MB-3u-78]
MDNNRSERAIKPFVMGRKLGCSVKLPTVPMRVRRFILLLRPLRSTASCHMIT